jgi:catechol 2,3-dioxygenase-like lactoylglutathione lyase family enzyme
MISTVKQIECILYVSDQQRSKVFYTQLLGKEPELDVQGMTAFRLSESTRLGLMPADGMAKILLPSTPHPKLGDGIPRCELYLQVDDVEAQFSRIVSLQIKLISRPLPRDWGDTVCYLADPDGHIIALAQPTHNQ